ncbi:MAG TPA: DMT family transporter [Rectinemataceae bacterium]|nr:DMT family transporter [Rectinemataceae bacterium]
MTKDRSTARAFGLATAFLWGLSFLSIKTAIAEVPPMTLGLARFAVAILLLPLIALAVKEDLRVKARDIPMLVVGGLVGYTFYFFGENNGVKRLSASESSIIVGTIPVVTMLAERIFLRTRLSWRSWAGAALSLGGVVLIVAGTGGGTSSLPGYLFMGLAALSWVVYAFITRRISGRYGQVAVTFWQTLFGFIGFIPFALAESASWRVPSSAAILNILYLGIFCSALGYWLYIMALDSLGPGASSVFINLIPVVSVIAAFFILGDRLSASQWAGAVVAIAGVYLATMPTKRSAPRG